MVILPLVRGLRRWNFLGRIDEEITKKKSRFTEPQILGVLRRAEGGVHVAELCRGHGISSATFYKWKASYGAMDASMVSQMKALEDENRRLKRMFADLGMQADLHALTDEHGKF